MISSSQSQYVLVNSSQYWSWYATQERWDANSQPFQALLFSLPVVSVIAIL